MLSLKSGRLVLVSLAMLVIAMGAALASLQRYRDRGELFRVVFNEGLYAIEDARTYGELQLRFERPPDPLSLITEGLGESYGSSAAIRGRFGGLQLRARELAEAGASWDGYLDFAQIIALFLTLLAFLVSYDCLCGERENGTLQLALANSLSRPRYLFGNFLGCLLALAVPLSLALTLCGLFLAWLGELELNAENAFRFGLFATSAVALASASLWLGLTCSAVARKSTTAFIVAFGAWASFALVFPNVLSWASELAAGPLPGEAESGILEYARRQSAPGKVGEVDSERERRRELVLNFRLAQAERAAELSVLSPFGAFIEATRALTRTDTSAQREFVRQARTLNVALTRWQAGKLARFPERAWRFSNSWEPLDKEGLPSALPRPVSLAASLRGAGPHLGALAVYNVLFCLSALLAFRRYDVRFG